MWIRIVEGPVHLHVRPDRKANVSATLESGAVTEWTRDRKERGGTWRHLRTADGGGGWAPPGAAIEEMPLVALDAEQAPVRDKPGASAEIVRVLKRGAKFRVIGEKDGFTRVLFTTGSTAWIPADAPVVSAEMGARGNVRAPAVGSAAGGGGIIVGIALIALGALSAVWLWSRGYVAILSGLIMGAGVVRLTVALSRRRAGEVARTSRRR